MLKGVNGGNFQYDALTKLPQTKMSILLRHKLICAIPFLQLIMSVI
jgi:hypothetical protein